MAHCNKQENTIVAAPVPHVVEVARKFGLVARKPAEDLDFYVIDGFAEFLGLDAKNMIHTLDKAYPKRGAGDALVYDTAQWVDGANKRLRYRGKNLKRRKMWFQDGRLADGTLVYSYTGFQWAVALATSDWNDDPMIRAASERMNAFMEALGGPPMNHCIVTAYDTGKDNIGFHTDKMKSLHKKTWIAVVKLGPDARNFAVRRVSSDKKLQEKMPLIFNERVKVGACVLMSAEANLATQHGVPVVDGEVGVSGSIVYRNVTNRVRPRALGKRIEDSLKSAERRASLKRRRENA